MPDSFYFFKWFLLYPLVIQITLMVLYKFAPAKNQSKYNADDAKKAIKKFGNIYLFISILAVIFIFGTAYLLMLFLLQLQMQYLNSYAPDIEYAVGFSQWGYGIPAMLLTGAIAQVGFRYIMEAVRYLKKASKKELSVYLAERSFSGFALDPKKLGRITMIILAPTSLIWILLALNTYTLVGSTGITYNKFFSLEEEHSPMSNVTDIYYVQSYLNRKTKKIVSMRPYFSVKTSDGFIWKTNNTSIHETKMEKEIVDFISNKAGTQIKKGTANIDD